MTKKKKRSMFVMYQSWCQYQSWLHCSL